VTFGRDAFHRSLLQILPSSLGARPLTPWSSAATLACRSSGITRDIVTSECDAFHTPGRQHAAMSITDITTEQFDWTFKINV
jgi:hypothetical protein